MKSRYQIPAGSYEIDFTKFISELTHREADVNIKEKVPKHNNIGEVLYLRIYSNITGNSSFQ